MQTKFSYRVLKWTFLVGAFATLGTACVVTSGDGDDDFPGDGGESGSSSTTAGKASTAGSGGSATAGTSSGGKGGTATTPAGGAGGAGGDGDGYVPGACEEDLAIPSNPRDTTLNTDDAKPEFACRKCLKVSCTEAWSTCYGDTPTLACGFGSTEDAPGQFECIRSCFVDDMSGDDTETVLSGCESKCLDQCADEQFATSETQEMLDCGQEECLAECFTP